MIVLMLAATAVAAPLPQGCNAPLPATSATVARVIGRRPRAEDRLVWGVAPASDDGPEQVYAYARAGASWLAYMPGDSQQVVSAYRTPVGGWLLFAWHHSGDPGEEFSGLLFDARGRLLACPSLDNPHALNLDERTNERDWKQEFMRFERIAIARSGRGHATTSAEIDVAGRAMRVVFRYTTTDGGRSWSRGKAMSRTPFR